ncbi:MAG: alpha/beta hydrolase, partial [Spirochaetaceae bacterium]
AMGRRIYDAANDPKSFYRITGAGHNDTYVVGGAPYFRELRAFWEGL